MYNIIRVLTKRVCMKDNCYRHINGVPYKMHCFIEMQFAAYFYTVVPYQALIMLPIYKNPAISKLGAIFLSFCKIRDFDSPTNWNPVALKEPRHEKTGFLSIRKQSRRSCEADQCLCFRYFFLNSKFQASSLSL